MSGEIVAYKDLQSMAVAMTKSGMFGKSQDQMVSLMLIAQAEGLHPAIAAMEYDIIQGRPALKAQAALARFQQSGGYIKWESRTDKEARATFSHPLGGSLTISWTMDKATKMGLAGRDNWKKQPEVMLAWRCVAEGVRAVYPACLNRMYLAEEVQDFDPLPRNVTDDTKTNEVNAVDPNNEVDEWNARIDASVASGRLTKSDADMWRDRLAKPASRKASEDWIKANTEQVIAPMSAGKDVSVEAEIVDEKPTSIDIDEAADDAFKDVDKPASELDIF